MTEIQALLDRTRNQIRARREEKLSQFREKLDTLKRPRIRLAGPFLGFRQEEDVGRIVRVLSDQGIRCEKKDAMELWERYFGGPYTPLLPLPDRDDKLLECLLTAIDLDELTEDS